MTEIQETYGLRLVGDTRAYAPEGGPHCALCGDGADDLVIISSQCEKNGLGKFVCRDCCLACDLGGGCVVFFEYEAARARGSE